GQARRRPRALARCRRGREFLPTGRLPRRRSVVAQYPRLSPRTTLATGRGAGHAAGRPARGRVAQARGGPERRGDLYEDRPHPCRRRRPVAPRPGETSARPSPGGRAVTDSANDPLDLALGYYL